MRHAVSPLQPSHAAQQFFTYFYRLERLTTLVQTDRPRRLISTSRSCRKGRAQTPLKEGYQQESGTRRGFGGRKHHTLVRGLKSRRFQDDSHRRPGQDNGLNVDVTSTPSLMVSQIDKRSRGVHFTSGPEALRDSSTLNASNDLREPQNARHVGFETVPIELVVKNVFRFMPHSVVVITACAPDNEMPDKDNSPYRAMTASSLTSVTMTESPVISFNIKTPSSTFDGIKYWSRFRVHILSNSMSGAGIANAFSTGNATHGFAAIAKLATPASVTAPSSPKSDAASDDFPAPLIHHPAVVATLGCKLKGDLTVKIQDHMVVFADVQRISAPPHMHKPDPMEPLKAFNGLRYQNRQYRLETGRGEIV